MRITYVKRTFAAMLAAISLMGTVALSSSADSFTLSVVAGGGSVSSSAVNKTMSGSASVYVSNVYNIVGNGVATDFFDVTFRVRNSAGSYATVYYDFASEMNGSPNPFPLPYLPNMEVVGNIYYLYSSLDSGQAVTSLTTTGSWTP